MTNNFKKYCDSFSELWITRALKEGKIQIKELPIVVYCAHSKCNSSHIAAEELLKKGFVNISEYKGGMKEYNKKSKAWLDYSHKGGYLESKEMIYLLP